MASLSTLQILYWHWWALAVGLLVLEALLPGAVFLWMGVSAVVVGAALLLLPELSWEIQLLIFSALSVVAVSSWLFWRRRNPGTEPEQTLNQRGKQYVGQSFLLQEPVVDGHGRLTLSDTIWHLLGPDCAAHTRIRIIAVDGSNLRFELVDDKSTEQGNTRS